MLGADLAAALGATLLLALVAAYVWYNFTGWQPFRFQTGSVPTWVPSGGADVSRLRFKGCTFAVALAAGPPRTADVSAALNSMAVAYKGGKANPAALTLTGPLNPFSFVIEGFNDRATVPDPTVAPWCDGCGARAALAGQVRTI